MELIIKGHRVLIDDEDYIKVSAHGWCPSVNKSKVYFSASIKKLGASPIPLHRFLMGCSQGDNITIDHINGNTLDNRKCNLRKCDMFGNCRNANIYKNNTTGYKGVSFRHGRYLANIKVQYKKISLGTWDTPEEASRAYDIAAIYYFQEFANTNHSKDTYKDIDIEQELISIIRKPHRRTSSGIVGVHYDKTNNKWKARISAHTENHIYKAIHLGSFDTKEEATIARKNAESFYNKKAKADKEILQEEDILIIRGMPNNKKGW